MGNRAKFHVFTLSSFGGVKRVIQREREREEERENYLSSSTISYLVVENFSIALKKAVRRKAFVTLS